jgi:hypothetical protein
LPALAENRVHHPRVDADQPREILGHAVVGVEVVGLAPRGPAGHERRQHRLLDAAQDRRDAAREVVVEQDRARIESLEAHAVAAAHDRLERELRCVGGLDRGRLLQVGDEAADAYLEPRALEDALQRRDVGEVARVARVVLGHQHETAGVGADLLHRRHRGVHAERQEIRIEVVEAAGKEVGVHRRQLEAAVAQVHRGVERRLVLEPPGAEPALDLGALLEDHSLELRERSGE